MNYDKAQKEIISAMLRNERIVAWHDNENLCVTPDGFKCFIFQPDVQIIFNHEKMTKLDIVPLNLTFRQLVRPDNRIDMTDFCVVHSKERIRLFLNHGENVYGYYAAGISDESDLILIQWYGAFSVWDYFFFLFYAGGAPS